MPVELLPPATAAHSRATFLALPVEIRLRVYTFLFHCAGCLVVEPASPASQPGLDEQQPDIYDRDTSPTWNMAHGSATLLSSSLPQSPVRQRQLRPRTVLSTPARLPADIHRSSTYSLRREQIRLLNAPPHQTSYQRSSPHQTSHTSTTSSSTGSNSKTSPGRLPKTKKCVRPPAWRSSSSTPSARACSPPRAEDQRTGHLARALAPLHRRLQQLAIRGHEVLRTPTPPGRAGHLPETRPAALRPAGGRRGNPSRGAISAKGPRTRACRGPIPELRLTARIRWRFVTEKVARSKKDGEEIVDLESELAALSGPMSQRSETVTGRVPPSHRA